MDDWRRLQKLVREASEAEKAFLRHCVAQMVPVGEIVALLANDAERPSGNPVFADQ